MSPKRWLVLFLIVLSLQLCAILSRQNDEKITGLSMTLHTKRKSKISVEEPLYYPIDFMEYYIKLSVGTPAQDLLLVMDTGSSVVWTPCTTNYTCNNNSCPGYRTVFLPSMSSTAVPVKCADPKCKDLFESSIHNCSGVCPGSVIRYVSGHAAVHLLTETLTLPLEGGSRRAKKDFGIGCSVVSFGFAGIAGFGRGGLSMPSQLSPLLGDRFAYCLDDLNNSSMIILGDMAVRKDIPFTYTPFADNPKPNPNPRAKSAKYSQYYYVDLAGVSIGGKRLGLSSNLLTFDSEGNGGTIIDSGTSYSYFPETIYKQIVGEFASQIGYRRVHADGYDLCYNVSGVNVKNIELPRFGLHLKGGSDMVVPNENSFIAASTDNILADTSDTICLAIMNAGIVPDGPAVVIGNFMQNNFYFLFDRSNNRLGFARQTCKALTG